jgi:hypothetical protein
MSAVSCRISLMRSDSVGTGFTFIFMSPPPDHLEQVNSA